MRRYHLSKIMAIVVLSTFLFTGVIFAQQKTITIRTWYSSGPRMDLFKEVFSKFEEETGIRVVHESPTTYSEFVNRLILDAISGLLPDIIMTNNFTIADLAEQDIIIPLDDYLTRSNELQQDVFPALWDAVTYEGRVWGVPFAGGPQRATWINKQLFSEFGLDIDDRSVITWDQFRDYVTRLTLDTNGDGVPDVFGLENLNQPYAFYWTNGATIFNADQTDFAFTEPQAVQTLEYMVDLAQRNVAGGKFLSGTAAMTLSTGPFSLRNYRDNAPFELGMGLPPQNISPSRTLASMDTLTVSADSPNADEAWQLIEYMLDPDFHARWSVETGFPPVRRGEIVTAHFQAAIDVEPLFLNMADMNEVAVQWPVYPNGDAILAVLRGAIREALSGTTSPTAALENAQRVAQQYLK